MDSQLIQWLSGIILGSGGIVGLVNFLRVQASKKAGAPGDEPRARRVADYASLNRYWQSEVAAFRKERAEELASLKAEIVTLRHLRHLDSLYIDDLEEQIWTRREPPPVKRRTE